MGCWYASGAHDDVLPAGYWGRGSAGVTRLALILLNLCVQHLVVVCLSHLSRFCAAQRKRGR